MDDQYFGMKEIYEVVLRTTERMQLGNRMLEKGEPVTYFDSIQIASLTESIRPIAARGGRRNDPLVIWEDRENVTFRMTMGVLSDIGFALLTNAKIIPKPDTMYVSAREIIELDDNGDGFVANHNVAANKPYFFFEYSNRLIQKKIKPQTFDLESGQFSFGEEYANTTVLVDYQFIYDNNASIYVLERERFNGLFELEGKINRKGEVDGVNRTSLFRLPKARITSNLNIIVGNNAAPTLSNFNILATPQKTQYSDYSVVEIFMLDENV